MDEGAAYRVTGEAGEAGIFVVRSASVDGVGWLVEARPDRRFRCPCTGFRVRGTCRHALAARAALQAEPVPSLADQLGRSVAAERLRRVGEALNKG